VNKSNIVVKKYPQHNYYTVFFKDTGFFLRKSIKGNEDTTWSPDGPELIDFAITNKCTGKYGDGKTCLFCYRNSTPGGKNISLRNFDEAMRNIRRLKTVNTIALGGGNPPLHPHFPYILNVIRRSYNIVPTYTYNGFGLSDRIRQATKDECGAIAISYYGDKELVIREVKENKDIKMNMHWVLSNDSIDEAIDWLEKDLAPDGLNAIIFLTWKTIGRASSIGELNKQDPRLDKFIKLVFEKQHKHKIGFDSCFTTAIASRIENANYDTIDGCEAGCFSMFIDEELTVRPCSFMTEGVDLRFSDLGYVWKNSELFNETRRYLLTKRCDCKHYSLCKNGCPQMGKNLCKNLFRS